MDCRSIALLTFAAYTGAFQLTTSKSEATVGVNFSLICTGNQQFISFKKNSQLFCITNGITNGSCNLNVNCPQDYHYQCKSLNLVTFKLTIPGSLLSESLHGSQWSCESVFGIGTPSNVIQLHVNIPIAQVTIQTAPLDRDPIEVQIGKTQKFICLTDEGRPSSKIHWYMSGANITDSSSQSDMCNSNCNGTFASSSVLVYTGNLADDGKNIYCTASNTESRSVRSYNRTVVILYRPVVSVFPIYNPYNVIENTTDLHLTCRVIAANPEVTSFRWYKDGTMISTGSTFIISKVQRYHQGMYTCDGNNSVGYSNQSSEILLNVFYGVKLNTIDKQRPVESKSFSILCTGSSNPDIADMDVTWTKQSNNTFRHMGQRLVIDHVNTIDSGIFICNVVIELKPSVGEVVNIIGTTPMEVEVLYRPVVQVSPSFNPYNVVENATNLQLTCTVTESNTHIRSYRWYKDSSVVSTDLVYIIIRVGRTHYGLYTCEATNTAGSGASAAIQLNVLYGITLNSIHMPKPHEGLQLIMTCNGSSNPQIKDKDVTWSKRNNDTFTQTGTKLLIKNVNILDGGTYICTVIIELQPSIGQTIVVKGTTHVMVDVLFKPMADKFKLQTKTVVGVKENDKLFLNIHLVANPIPLLQWSFINDVNIGTCSNNTISSNDTFQGIHVSTSISILNLQKEQFGTYILISKNSIGVYSRIYTVVLQGNPSPSLLITVLCKSTSALVLWTPGFDGGNEQGFYVRYWRTNSMGTPIISKFLSGNIQNQTFNHEVTSLDEKTKYTFSIISTNEHGNASSGVFECVTDALFITDDDNILKTGIALLVIGSVAVVGVAVFSVIFCVRKQILKSSTRMREYGEVGTTRNPAYSTSYDTLQDGAEKQTGSTNDQAYSSINDYEECGNRSYENRNTQKDTTCEMEKFG